MSKWYAFNIVKYYDYDPDQGPAWDGLNYEMTYPERMIECNLDFKDKEYHWCKTHAVGKWKRTRRIIEHRFIGYPEINHCYKFKNKRDAATFRLTWK